MSQPPHEPEPAQFRRRMAMLAAIAALGMALLTARLAWLYWVHG